MRSWGWPTTPSFAPVRLFHTNWSEVRAPAFEIDQCAVRGHAGIIRALAKGEGLAGGAEVLQRKGHGPEAALSFEDHVSSRGIERPDDRLLTTCVRPVSSSRSTICPSVGLEALT